MAGVQLQRLLVQNLGSVKVLALVRQKTRIVSGRSGMAEVKLQRLFVQNLGSIEVLTLFPQKVCVTSGQLRAFWELTQALAVNLIAFFVVGFSAGLQLPSPPALARLHRTAQHYSCFLLRSSPRFRRLLKLCCLLPVVLGALLPQFSGALSYSCYVKAIYKPCSKLHHEVVKAGDFDLYAALFA